MFPEVRLGLDPTFPRYKGTWAVTAPLVSTTIWDCTLSAGLGHLIDGLLRYSPVITRQLALPDTCLLQKKKASVLFCLLPKKPREEWKEGGALGTARVGCWVPGWLRSWELSHLQCWIWGPWQFIPHLWRCPAAPPCTHGEPSPPWGRGHQRAVL